MAAAPVVVAGLVAMGPDEVAVGGVAQSEETAAEAEEAVKALEAMVVGQVVRPAKFLIRATWCAVAAHLATEVAAATALVGRAKAVSPTLDVATAAVATAPAAAAMVVAAARGMAKAVSVARTAAAVRVQVSWVREEVAARVRAVQATAEAARTAVS